MSLRQKAEKIDWEELGSNASFLPLVYLVVMAPGFLILLGFSCLMMTAVGDFPSGLKLGSIFIASSLILMVFYRIMIKLQFKMKKKLSEEVPVELPGSAIDKFVAPFLAQLQHEQKMLLGKIE